MNIKNLLFLFLSTLLLLACDSKSQNLDTSISDYQEELQIQLLDAKPGDIIEIPAGKYSFSRSLSLSVDGVTIRGAGMNDTILSFKDQVTGAEGLLVTANDFTLENLAIEDTIGDAVKVNEGNNIIIRGVRVEWTNGPSTKNGAYGLYPVQTTNVLLEDNVSIGASDAGIYVGQSKDVIVRRNRAEFNVAGIEIENTINADVYENIATNNTGGILVFNMPNLPQEGKYARVFKNKIIANNTKNFGHKGTPVASVPAGTGVIVNSNDYVEIFNNEIADNKTANVIISSVYSTNYADDEAVENYDPYPEAIYIYANQFSGGGDSPDGLDLKALKVAMYGFDGAFPDVLWDGYFNQEKFPEGLSGEYRICINGEGIELLNADGPGGYKNPSKDIVQHQCDLNKLPIVELAISE